MKSQQIGKFIILSKTAYRNLFRNFRRSLFSIIAIMMAVFFIIFFMSYIDGMIGSMKNVMKTYETGSIFIADKDFIENKDFYPVQYPLQWNEGGIDSLISRIKEIKGVQAVFPRIRTFATLTDNLVKHAAVWGIDFENEKQNHSFNITNLSDGLILGNSFKKDESGRYKNECIVGISLALKLKIIKEIMTLDEWASFTEVLSGEDRKTYESSYQMDSDKNIYRLNIGTFTPVKVSKKESLQQKKENDRIRKANREYREKQIQLLEIILKNHPPVLPMKIISSQYSDKFTRPVITGIFDFDFEAFNSQMIIMPFDRLQSLLNLKGKAQSLAVYAQKDRDVPRISKEIRALFSSDNPVKVIEWFNDPKITSYNQITFIYNFIYIFFVSIASFLIINTIIMIIHERIKEIGMMGSLGMSKFEIIAVFFLEALFLSILGSLAGTVLSGIITALLSNFPIKFLELTGGIDMPMSNTIYLTFSWGNLASGFLIGIFVSGFCTLIPSMTSVKIEPVEALRR